MRVLAVLLVGAAAIGSAEAAPRKGPAPTADAALARLQDEVTDCFAHQIRSSRRATALARAGKWYEAAGLSASLCRPEVGAMVRRHDELHGFGSGHRYFTKTYVRGLDKRLAARMAPVLEAAASTE